MPQRPTIIPVENITEEDFAAYEEIRQEGSFNMIAQEAQWATGLDRDVHFSVMKHYDALREMYPNALP